MVLNKCWETKRDSKQKHNQIAFEMSSLKSIKTRQTGTNVQTTKTYTGSVYNKDHVTPQLRRSLSLLNLHPVRTVSESVLHFIAKLFCVKLGLELKTST